MKNINELMDMVNSFNIALDDIESATTNNVDIATDNIHSVLKKYEELLRPYIQVITNVIEPRDNSIDVMHRNYKGLGNWLEGIRFTPLGRILVQYKSSMDWVDFNGDFLDKLSTTEIQDILRVLFDCVGDKNSTWFDEEFSRRIRGVMENKVKEADKKYKASMEFKNLTQI